MASRMKRFTIYDMMEEKGVFDANPANPTARDAVTGESIYQKQEFPRMYYHPTGAKRLVEPERKEPTSTGIVVIPARYELITAVAKDETAATKLETEGWHRHPKDSMRAGGDEVPKSQEEIIAELQAQLAVAKAEGAKPASAPASSKPSTSKTA